MYKLHWQRHEVAAVGRQCYAQDARRTLIAVNLCAHRMLINIDIAPGALNTFERDRLCYDAFSASAYRHRVLGAADQITEQKPMIVPLIVVGNRSTANATSLSRAQELARLARQARKQQRPRPHTLQSWDPPRGVVEATLHRFGGGCATTRSVCMDTMVRPTPASVQVHETELLAFCTCVLCMRRVGGDFWRKHICLVARRASVDLAASYTNLRASAQL